MDFICLQNFFIPFVFFICLAGFHGFYLDLDSGKIFDCAAENRVTADKMLKSAKSNQQIVSPPDRFENASGPFKKPNTECMLLVKQVQFELRRKQHMRLTEQRDVVSWVGIL